jgi:hypothetical protein
MPVGAQLLLPLMGGDFVALSFPTARHSAYSFPMENRVSDNYAGF